MSVAAKDQADASLAFSMTWFDSFLSRLVSSYNLTCSFSNMWYYKTMAKNTYSMKRILIIEDDQMLVVAYKMKLSPHFELKHAATGEEGVKLTYEWSPHLILLDLYLPGKTGKDVLKELKANKNTQSIPVMVFTNLENECASVLACGACDCASKVRVSMQDVFERINKHLL